MFNFFEELKKNVEIFEKDDLFGFNIINISGKLIYVEGHKGLVTLSPTLVAFRVKKEIYEISGENMTLAELTENTLKIVGIINKVEKVN